MPRAALRSVLSGLAFGALLLAALAAAEPIKVTAAPVALDANDATRDRVGPLRWLGGLELTAADRRFGGFSGLHVAADGTVVTAVTDDGHWLRARLRYAADGWLSGLEDATLGPLHGPEGEHLTDKARADAESLSALPDGALAVAFERRHRIWIYPASEAPLARRPGALPPPPGLDSAEGNSGMEALATLADGSLFVALEGGKTAASSPAYLWRGGTWSRLTYPHPVGFRPTGATRLPDGDLLVLERSFNILDGVAIRLARIAARDLRPGAALEGREVAAALAADARQHGGDRRPTRCRGPDARLPDLRRQLQCHATQPAATVRTLARMIHALRKPDRRRT